MIVVTGANGQLGQLIIAELLNHVPASTIVATVRDTAKAGALSALGVQVRKADYNESATLDAAFAGAEKILLVSSSEVGQRLAQHRNVIDAARRAGVGLLAYTSVLHADRSPLALAGEHRDTEDLLRSSGLRTAILRNGWYVENYTAGLAGALAHGVLLGCAQDGRISAASRADYAAAAAAVLTASAPEALYELAGDHSFSLPDLAAELSRQAGKPVPYQDLPQAQYKAALLGAGLPEWLAALLSDSDAGVAQGALEDNGGALSRLIGRATTPLAEAVHLALAK